MEHHRLGASIRAERLRQNWSQEGLCAGICAVSYLSKIEQGKTEASPEILHLLLERLGLQWYDDAQMLSNARSQMERIYDAIFAHDFDRANAAWTELLPQEDRLLHGPLAAEIALLRQFLQRGEPLDACQEACLDRRQLALQRMLQGRSEEAMRLYPCAYLSLMAGISAYEDGSNEALAWEYLHESYDLAAREGHALVMLMAKLYLGNYASNRLDIVQMQEQYRIAARLAAELHREDLLHDIRYNTAATFLEVGRYEEAYASLAAEAHPSALELHKLAICCEKLGKRDEALAALDQAMLLPCEFPEKSLIAQMCSLVRYRLCHGDYLHETEYGNLLLAVFHTCRRELPIGYASFHLPWVLEWYTANRQYRLAYELLRDFPVKPSLN